MIVKDVLGNELAVYEFPDGSYTCPFCSSAVMAPATTCSNPWCVANPSMPPAEAQNIYDYRRKKAEEEQRRKRDHELALERIRAEKAERRAWEAEQLAECDRRGACRRCLFQPGWMRTKFIKHRGPCPKERK